MVWLDLGLNPSLPGHSGLLISEACHLLRWNHHEENRSLSKNPIGVWCRYLSDIMPSQNLVQCRFIVRSSYRLKPMRGMDKNSWPVGIPSAGKQWTYPCKQIKPRGRLHEAKVWSMSASQQKYHQHNENRVTKFGIWCQHWGIGGERERERERDSNKYSTENNTSYKNLTNLESCSASDCLRYLLFLIGHPFKFWINSSLLNFSDLAGNYF